MIRTGPRLSRKEVAALPTGSPAEILLAVQLEQAGIPFEREYRFAPSRRWRADFVIFIRQWASKEPGRRPSFDDPVLVEIEGGSFSGGHKRGMAYETDTEKASAAAILGYRVVRATPRQVEDGRALAWIEAALGRKAA